MNKFRKLNSMLSPSLVFGLVISVLHLDAFACRVVPTKLDVLAQRMWTSANKVCVVTLNKDSLVLVSGLPQDASKVWRVTTQTLESLKGKCLSESVIFDENPDAMCGLGMAPLDIALLATFDANGKMTWWSPTKGQLDVHFRDLASAQPK